MKLFSGILAVIVMAVLLLVSTAAYAKTTQGVEVGVGRWIPADSSEWESGAAVWCAGGTGRFAGRFLVGRADDATAAQLGGFTILEIAGEYRIKQASPKKGFDWYLGVGAALVDMSTTIGGVTVEDTGIGPAVSLGVRINGNFGIDVHGWRAEDSVDIGGTTIGVSYSW